MAYFAVAGTGKTLLARAVANRTDACFIRVIGSELVQKYVGEGARMVRELFQMARSKKACLIFFDEVATAPTASSPLPLSGTLAAKLLENSISTECIMSVSSVAHCNQTACRRVVFVCCGCSHLACLVSLSAYFVKCMSSSSSFLLLAHPRRSPSPTVR